MKRKAILSILFIGLMVLGGMAGFRAWWPELWTPALMKHWARTAEINMGYHEINLESNRRAQASSSLTEAERVYLRREEERLIGSTCEAKSFLREAKIKEFLARCLHASSSG